MYVARVRIEVSNESWRMKFAKKGAMAQNPRLRHRRRFVYPIRCFMLRKSAKNAMMMPSDEKMKFRKNLTILYKEDSSF